MRVVLLALLISLSCTSGWSQLGSITYIAEANKLKDKARQLTQEGKYKDAAAVYSSLLNKYGETDEAVYLNRAHLLYMAKQEQEAAEAYRALLTENTSAKLKSQAYTQLGYLAGRLTDDPDKSLQESLRLYKEALRADPNNEVARKNYELIYRKLFPRKPKEDKDRSDKKEPEDQQKEEEKLELSEWAKKQKAKADALVAEGKYNEAFELMSTAMQADSTVSLYQDYIMRLGEVANIWE